MLKRVQEQRLVSQKCKNNVPCRRTSAGKCPSASSCQPVACYDELSMVSWTQTMAKRW